MYSQVIAHSSELTKWKVTTSAVKAGVTYYRSLSAHNQPLTLQRERTRHGIEQKMKHPSTNHMFACFIAAMFIGFGCCTDIWWVLRFQSLTCARERPKGTQQLHRLCYLLSNAETLQTNLQQNTPDVWQHNCMCYVCIRNPFVVSSACNYHTTCKANGVYAYMNVHARA